MAALSSDLAVGVVGIGVMGAGIAQVAAAAGHRVLLWDFLDGAAQKAREGIALQLEQRVAKQRITAEDRLELLGRLEIRHELHELAEAGLVIEAISEDLDAKQGLFGSLERHLRDDAILATNTSSLSVTRIAAVLKRPERFAGLHFFNPAPVIPLVEIVSGLETMPEIAEALFDTARAWGKKPIHAKSVPGFVVNRGARPFYGEPTRFVEEGGADFATVDALLRAAGFRMGPFELLDLIGLDVNLAVSQSMFATNYGEPRYRPSVLVSDRVDAGRLGRKTGRGFYEYPMAGKAAPPTALAVGSVPTKVFAARDLPSDLQQRIRAGGMQLEAWDRPWSEVDGARFTLTRGRLADRGVTVIDIALDWAGCPLVAVAHGPEATLGDQVVAMLQAAGFQVAVVEDLPGLVVARTVCMLINEAYETVLKQVASRDEVDLAMELGLGFPGGPFAWCRQLGAAQCLNVLDGMASEYGEDRYRASVLLRREVNLENANA